MRLIGEFGTMSALMPGSYSSAPMQLPSGVSLTPLPDTFDQAGGMTELYRQDWQLDVVPIQWNFVCSRANTLRGVHVHVTHYDYLCVLRGEMLLALHDMRTHSPTYRLTVQLRLSDRIPRSVVIPPGVAHGFYFASETSYFYAVSHYWEPADELGCRWDDPELGFSWPTTSPLLSPRDAAAAPYSELMQTLSGTAGRDTARS
jgi:dTDP-4-dehydrorhamnose 3,5-epimerase